MFCGAALMAGQKSTSARRSCALSLPASHACDRTWGHSVWMPEAVLYVAGDDLNEFVLRIRSPAHCRFWPAEPHCRAVNAPLGEKLGCGVLAEAKPRRLILVNAGLFQPQPEAPVRGGGERVPRKRDVPVAGHSLRS